MLRKTFVLLLMSVFVLQLNQGHTQIINLTQNGNGARAAAMGYAFTGLADDATAISWNSAGLTQLYSMEAAIIGRFGAGSYDWTIEGVTPDITTKSNFQLNFASFIIPFSVGKFNIIGGVAYRTMYDFNEEVTVSIPDWDYNSESKEVGSVYAITPTLAMQIAESFSIGVAYNFYGGKYQYSLDGNLDEDTDSKFSSSSFDIGVFFRPSQKFSLGANLNLPYKMKRTYEVSGEEIEFDVPFFWSVGAAFRATDQFTVSFDFHARKWSDSDAFKEEVEVDKLDVDLNSFHVGLEYLIITQSVVIPLRGGFYTRPFHMWDKDNEQVKANVFTLGAGIMVGSLIFDAAFEFEPLSYEYSSTTTIEQKYLRMTLGATIHFGE